MKFIITFALLTISMVHCKIPRNLNTLKDDTLKCHDAFENFKDQAKEQIHHIHLMPAILSELKNVYEICKEELKSQGDCLHTLDELKDELEKIVVDHHFWDVPSAAKKFYSAYKECKINHYDNQPVYLPAEIKQDDPVSCYDTFENFKNQAKEQIHHIHLLPDLLHELKDVYEVCKEELKGNGECAHKLDDLKEEVEKIVIHHHYWDIPAAGIKFHDAYEECKIHHYDYQPVYLTAEIKQDEPKSCHDAFEEFKDQAKTQVKHIHLLPDLYHELKDLYEICKTEIKGSECDDKIHDAKDEVEKIVVDHHYWDIASAGIKIHDAYETCKDIIKNF